MTDIQDESRSYALLESEHPAPSGLSPSSQFTDHIEVPILTGVVMLRGKHSKQVASSRLETSQQLEKQRLKSQGDSVAQTIFPNEERVLKPMNIRRIQNVDPKTGKVLTDTRLQGCLEVTRHRILFASGYVVPGMSENNTISQGNYDLVTDVATVTCTHEQKFTAWNLPLTHVLNVELDTSLGIKSVKTVWAKRRMWIPILTLFLMLLEIGLVLGLSKRKLIDIIGGISGYVVMGLIGLAVYYFWTKFHQVPSQTKAVERKVLSISCISPTTFQPTITKIEFCFDTTNSNDLINALNHMSPKPGRTPVICAGTVSQIKVDSDPSVGILS
eukprot:TRINITY_DN2613_c0_g2_i1.p1 TRINITY_DN2613_c0_g2~~TRINITY_DN2613_c0_g2_i1.p1  ORF type:complete len:329 (+),score=64.95 TRINITY_DN2613_c0_g2_i1:128-1114(+)